MAARAQSLGRQRKHADTPRAGATSGGKDSWLRYLPRWVLPTASVLALVLILGGGGYWFYTALDPLYAQSLWRYFRPVPPLANGRVLYRDPDGQLFVAPLADLKGGRRLLDVDAAALSHEIVRDAVALPGGKHVAYYASERRDGGPEQDRLKVVTLDGAVVRSLPAADQAGEPLRAAVFASSTGRYVGLTNRDRSRAYYFDVETGAPLSPGTVDAPPERMLWTRNGDLRTAHVTGQTPYASSPDGKLRAQVRPGSRRAPECEEVKCEPGQELVITSGTVAGSSNPPTLLYGVFSSFSAEGWGPIPAQPAMRLYGRLVWAPDGSQVLFSTLDGAISSTYAVGTDGKTRPRLVLEAGEALDWLP
jgi:hypothetical protein